MSHVESLTQILGAWQLILTLSDQKPPQSYCFQPHSFFTVPINSAPFDLF